MKSGLPSSDMSPRVIGSISGGPLSWLAKCTKIFNLSPPNRVLLSKESNVEPSEQLDEAKERHQLFVDSGPINNHVNGLVTQTENSIREMEDGQAPLVDQRRLRG